MHLFCFLFLLISTLGFSQSDPLIVCATPGKRSFGEKANRISFIPEKISLNTLDSTIQDSVKFASLRIKNKVVVSIPESNAIYAGFDNLIQIGFTDKRLKRFQLKCEGCDTLYKHPNNQDFDWVLRANTSDKIILSTTNRKGEVHSTSEIPVLPLPIPTLFFDGKDAQSTLRAAPKQMRVKYDETIPLLVKFLIKRWEIKINSDESLAGYGTAIPEDVHNFMQMERRGTITIHFSYIGPAGEQRAKEIFEFDLD